MEFSLGLRRPDSFYVFSQHSLIEYFCLGNYILEWKTDNIREGTFRDVPAPRALNWSANWNASSLQKHGQIGTSFKVQNLHTIFKIPGITDV